MVRDRLYGRRALLFDRVPHCLTTAGRRLSQKAQACAPVAVGGGGAVARRAMGSGG